MWDARFKGTSRGWLREGATANTPAAVKGQIEKLLSRGASS